ncbi:uroporphyrinogen decarboxylase family protein [Chloroflexota bacterium]
MEKKWADLSPEEKKEARLKTWLSASGVNFTSQEAYKLYQERVTRLINVINLKEPDRVPVVLHVGFFPVYYGGITPETAMYDYEALSKVWHSFLNDFEMDTYSGPRTIGSGKVFEILDYKLYKWPGHGASPDSSYQCIEDEYMKEDEYDDLIRDPSDFWMRVYLPRIFKALEPFMKLSPFTDIIEMPSTIPVLVPYGRPDIQTAFQALLDTGKEALKWSAIIDGIDREALESGIPSFRGGMAKAPFDTIGDTLRGTTGIMLDMYRRPEKLLKAIERLIPIEIARGVSAANASGNPIIFMPLHKGADGFMSDRQFQRFYWPSLREVILGLNAEGIMPLLFAEGGYNTRLEVIKELPKCSVIWYFDQTDIFKAKEIIGDTACIMGNVPSSLLLTGTRENVMDHCRKLIEVVGKGGGYILSNGAVIDNAIPDNLRAMMATAQEYGVYL